MNKDNFYLYKDAILVQHPTAWHFTTPKNAGAQNNVIFATVGNKNMVFKFGDGKLVQKNEAVSKLYNMRGIPVPQIIARNQNGLHFEEYEKIQGISLFEAIKRGMPQEQIKQVYRDVIIQFDKMTRVHPTYINSDLTSAVHKVAKINIANVNGKMVANIFQALIFLLNIGANKGLYHSDITTKNIIVDKAGNFSSFIDVDSVNVCSKEYALQMLLSKYQELGFDPNELIELYRSHTHELISAQKISKRIKLLATGKKMLWQHSQSRKTK